jgi:hypothetical protein
MPYPNEHACRLADPASFQKGSFRRSTRRSKRSGKQYSVIFGRKKGSKTMSEQAYRYNKSNWNAAEARGHCRRHNGTFEAASKD